jgi:hypothetical protein
MSRAGGRSVLDRRSPTSKRPRYHDSPGGRWAPASVARLEAHSAPSLLRRRFSSVCSGWSSSPRRCDRRCDRGRYWYRSSWCWCRWRGHRLRANNHLHVYILHPNRAAGRHHNFLPLAGGELDSRRPHTRAGPYNFGSPASKTGPALRGKQHQTEDPHPAAECARKILIRR